MNIVERAKNILITPKTEWEVIKNEQSTVSDMFTKYALILALIPAFATFIGQSLIGVSLGPFGSFKLPVSTGLLYAFLQYILGLGGIFIVGYIIDALAPSFGATKDIVASFKVAIYSFTAFWIAGIFGILPIIGILVLLGLYSYFLLYLGLKIVKDAPQDKLVGYFIVVILVSLIIYFIVGAIATAIALPNFGDLGKLNFN